MSEKKIPSVITYDFLKKVRYQDLESIFEKIGVKDAFVVGEEKESLIQSALSKLAKIKELESKGIKEEDIDKELEIAKEKEKEEKEKEALAKKIKDEEDEKNRIKNIKKKELSREELEKNLSIVDMNLSNKIPGQRIILLQKRKALQELLDGLDR